jgi:hypothetical protein
MGNSESNGNPIRNMDKRTARREYADAFAAAIERYREDNGLVLNPRRKQDSIEGIQGDTWDGGVIRVCVRKRPIHKRELDAYEFDCISISSREKVAIVHDARMHIDMKRQFLNNHEFDFDQVFDEYTDNEQVA